MFLIDAWIIHEEVLIVHKYIKGLIHFLFYLSLTFILLLMIIWPGLDFTYG